MADIKKFLDQAGVGVLWSRITDELKGKQTAIDAVKATAEANTGKITTLEGKVDNLEKNAYDDTEVRGLISTNANNITANTNAIATLNGDANVEGSVSKKVAEGIASVVAGADASFDTLKEIADWIVNDTTGAASMANKITALETLVGNTAVATQIANAIDAALKSKEKEIEVDLKDKADCLLVIISNTYDKSADINKVGKSGFTTKGVGHGFGLSIVKDIARTNTEIETFSTKETDKFIQTAMIYYKK